MENNYDENASGAEQNKSNSDPENGSNATDNSKTEGQSQSQKNFDWKTIDEDPTKIKMDRDLSELTSGLIGFIKSTLSLRHGKYDFHKVVGEAKENVVFRGYNVWILICSIVVASIGLDVNSPAIVIGAMLISPLMGPIRGIGFGVGMNDFPLLIKSFKNFGVMVGISLLTSVVYFWISPLDSLNNGQLLGRTEPNFLDALIAFFGGLAGIIAASNGKNDTVINGVAIATALMPPLCTAGFGLANGEWGFFFGASYLFLLNSLFIALSTYVLLRYLRFPQREYVSKKIENRVKLYTIIILVLIVSPSAYLFYRMAKKSAFETNAIAFTEEVVKTTEDNIRVEAFPIFDMDNPILELNIDNAYIDSTTLVYWDRQKYNHGLDDVSLVVKQGEDINALTDRKIKEVLGMSHNQNELVNMLKDKERLIENMRQEFESYKEVQEGSNDPVNFDYILRGFREEYAEINRISINRSFSYDRNKLDTTYVIAVDFKPEIPVETQNMLKTKISRRFCFELKEQANVKLDSVSIVNF